MALFDDFCRSLWGLDRTQAGEKLPGIVASIKALPPTVQITVSDSTALYILKSLRRIDDAGDRTLACSSLAEVFPHLKISKKFTDTLLAYLLDWALYTKNADLENFCVSKIPAQFSPNTSRKWGLRLGYFAFSLFMRAFLSDNEADKEKYLHESLRQFLWKPNYDYTYSIKDRAEEVEKLLKARRSIVYKELLLEYLNKKKQFELFEVLSTMEFSWELGGKDGFEVTIITLKVPTAELENITGETKEKILHTLKDAKDVTGVYPDKVSFVEQK
jgi:hypothetical protein